MTVVLLTAALALQAGDLPELTMPNQHEMKKLTLTAYVPCDRQCRRTRIMRRVVAPYRAKLERMARCESGGRWWIATGNGFYGGLQFVPSTWWSVGGTGMPHQASKLEQMYRAVKLIRRAGYGPWPVCGSA